MQTKIASLAEAASNIAIGIAVGFVSNIVVLPLFGYDVNLTDAMGISLVFTAISLVRSYVLRRVFNKMKWGNK